MKATHVLLRCLGLCGVIAAAKDKFDPNIEDKNLNVLDEIKHNLRRNNDDYVDTTPGTLNITNPYLLLGSTGNQSPGDIVNPSSILPPIQGAKDIAVPNSILPSDQRTDDIHSTSSVLPPDQFYGSRPDTKSPDQTHEAGRRLYISLESTGVNSMSEEIITERTRQAYAPVKPSLRAFATRSRNYTMRKIPVRTKPTMTPSSRVPFRPSTVPSPKPTSRPTPSSSKPSSVLTTPKAPQGPQIPARNAIVYRSKQNQMERFKHFVHKNKALLSKFLKEKQGQPEPELGQYGSLLDGSSGKGAGMIIPQQPLLPQARAPAQQGVRARPLTEDEAAALRMYLGKPPPPPLSLSPDQLDMAPAKGAHVHRMRLRGRMCQRNVLVPEGPKYDSQGNVYLAGYQHRDGRDYSVTRRPRMLLPRCCNCCKKSVLGCQ